MAKMFKVDGQVMRTWNPFTGCRFDCSYCWARDKAEGRLKQFYPNGFVPEWHPERRQVNFKAKFVFVCSMGDISFASWSMIHSIFDTIQDNPNTNFLIMTKSPGLYTAGPDWPENVIQGTTIETNFPISISKAPAPATRYGNMVSSKHPRKLVSIEPIMDFALPTMTTWIKDIHPEMVQIGADNYNHHLPEPPWSKVAELISAIEQAGIKVEQKEGLNRLRDTR